MNQGILLLLWHPDQPVPTSGGLVRTKEFLRFFPQDFHVTVLDKYPTILADLKFNGRVVEYKLPSIVDRIYNWSFLWGRILEWSLIAVILTIKGWQELKTKRYKVIYAPIGEALHIFLPAVILKKLFPSVSVIIDVLNFEIPEGGFWQYYKSLRSNKIGRSRSFVSPLGIVISLLLMKRLIRNVNYVVTVSPHVKRKLAPYYHSSKISVTPSGVSIGTINSVSYKKILPKYDGVFVGRHTSEKGIFDLVKVWENVTKIKKGAKLIMIGPCDRETKLKLEGEIEKKKLKKNIFILGVLSEEEKFQRLRESRVFIHLAHFEPLVPVITILEALSCGLPVVHYNVAALKDYPELYNHPSFYLVENKNIRKATKKVLAFLFLRPEEVKRISSEARKYARRFAWRKIAQDEAKIIKKFCKMTVK